jgi:hypothetical protein
MIKLLNAYRADPSEKNALRLAAYQAKHPMAACFLATDDLLDLKEALNISNKVLVSLAKA